MRSTAETGLRINTLALAETVYLFCHWGLKIYEHAVPPPARLRFLVMFSNMTMNGRPFSLNPYRPNDFNLGDNRHPAPGAAPEINIEIDAERANAEPGVIAYRLLAEFYAWFGFNASEMPYVNRGSDPPRIDPAQIH